MSDSRLPAVVWRGETIPLLVLGTAQLGLPGYGIANRTGGMESERVDGIIRAAWESGVRFFDTAQAYGNSEKRLGRAFRNLGLGDARVVTKLEPALDCTDARVIAASLDASRTRLGRDCVWGVMLHRHSCLKDWDSGLGHTLKAAREQGFVKHLGVSVYGAGEALAAIEHPDMDIIQIPANAWDSRMARAGVFAKAKERDKLLFVRSVFLQGLMFLSPAEAEANVPGAGRSVEMWAGLCRRYGCSCLELAARWAAGLHCPLVIGAETPRQAMQLARILVSFDGLEHDVSAMEALESETILNPSLWRK